MSRYTAIIGSGTLAFGTFTSVEAAKRSAAEAFPGQKITVLMFVDAPTKGSVHSGSRERIEDLERSGPRAAHAPIEFSDDLRARLIDLFARDPQAYQKLITSKVVAHNTTRNVLKGTHARMRRSTVIALERWLAAYEAGVPAQDVTQTVRPKAAGDSRSEPEGFDPYLNMVGEVDLSRVSI